MSKKKANRLIEVGKFKLVSKKPLQTCICEESVEAFFNEKAEFDSNYLACLDVFKMLGLSVHSFYKFLETQNQLNSQFTLEADFFKILELPENYYGVANQRYFFKRKDLDILQCDYVNLRHAQELVGQQENTSFSSWLQYRPQIQIFSFCETHRGGRFVKKSVLLEVHHAFKPKRTGIRYDKEKYCSYSEAQEVLQLSDHHFKNIIKEKLLVPSINIGRALLFEKEQVTSLVLVQQREFEHLKGDYLTFPQIVTKYPDINHNNLSVTKKIRKIEFSSLLSGILKKQGNQDEQLGKYLYHKEDVAEYHKFISIQNSIQLEASYSDPFKEYLRRIEINKLEFPVQCKITNQLLDEYVLEYLRSRLRRYDINGELWFLIRIAEALIKFTDKEIYEYTAKELNLLLLNNLQIVRKAREEIFQFLQFVNKLFLLRQSKSPFQFEALINPRKLPRENREKKVYSFEEYETFFKFTTDLEIHKKKAVSQALVVVENKQLKQYSGYDSIWLYMLLHLNNTWRHSDCLTIPRISLAGTGIKDLEWLIENDLSEDDVKKIIFRLKCAPLIVSKTQVERHFFCSSDVEHSLATAAAICELRTAALNDEATTIISGICYENEKMLKSKVLREFFLRCSDNDNFKFSNRAMNRTVISLIQSVQTFYGNDQDSEYLRILRSHADFETLDIYIQVPQERMDAIAQHLFDRDMFGHIPDVFSSLLFGASVLESKQTERIKEIKNNLGSIYKLEETAGFLNAIHDYNIRASRDFIENHVEYKDIIEELIRNLSSEEIHSLYYKIVTHQMPSKEKHLRCIVSASQCKFPARNCSECPLSIPHFYAISSLIERIFRKIKSIEDALSEQLPEAELTRLANWLEIDLDLLKHAQAKYGKSEIAMFASGLNNKLKTIELLRNYQTVNKKIDEVNR
ncbi:hypothetical protein B1748_04805 [Paenibacillus sp. MY03]|uniref:hypothetical protein n=1 Tax=Paenibacillus sp. MY03 TaxID=302980 RepID=UPI000B3CA107|nr:hypothetical protein [Paenibacillus sp. MY03]OUS78088.1 hypothetical protein B1748_04805 [Paenibacillus sp. MY03]